MGEFKRGEHTSSDPDEEIRTWEKRKVDLAGEDELAPDMGSLKQVEMGVDP